MLNFDNNHKYTNCFTPFMNGDSEICVYKKE